MLFCAGIVRAQLQTEEMSYRDASLSLKQSYIEMLVYITTTVVIRNNIPDFTSKVSAVCVVLLVHLLVTVLQVRTIHKDGAEVGRAGNTSDATAEAAPRADSKVVMNIHINAL